MFDPITLLAGLGPIVTDLGKSLINRYVAPDTFKPATIDQYVKMKQIDLEMFQAMNEAGGGNPSFPWVEAIIRLMRPTVGAIVFGVWAYLKITNQPSEAVDNFASAVGFYLFAERSLFYARKK
jgi:hypothetical protein